MPKRPTTSAGRRSSLPLQQDIGKALEVFAKARGITVIVDGSQVPVVYAADSIDITRAFINDFNSKNPATASVPSHSSYCRANRSYSKLIGPIGNRQPKSMIRHHLFPLSALMVWQFAISVSAQQQPAGRLLLPTHADPCAAAAPSNRSSANEQDGGDLHGHVSGSKTGIAKFNTVLTKLNGEFQKLKDELTQMQTRAQALEAEINKLREAPEGTPIDQKSLQAKIDQLEQLKKDIQRKGEDAQASYNRRRRSSSHAVAGRNWQSAGSVCQGTRHQRDHRRGSGAIAVCREKHRHHARVYHGLQQQESGYRSFTTTPPE
jgi:Skp family chaperone for outer membrane proteins